ncbi:unnamed protein product [Nezara viridula]|uniref:Uncharacterized protein n=1 Tax=Nezara viridula TaxID=85310 RepID=A0A9P0E5J1_NEZVI|nr:unnamed protein product [Nezara viridula]
MSSEVRKLPVVASLFARDKAIREIPNKGLLEEPTLPCVPTGLDPDGEGSSVGRVLLSQGPVESPL